jgi:hypothetical protein
VCQNLALNWLISFFIHLSSFQHMALAAMLPSRTVSSSINYLMISCLLVQFSLQYFSYSVILITHMLMFLHSPAHWVGKYLLDTNQRRFWYENRLLKVKHYVYAVYRMTMKMQNRIVMSLVCSQYSNWKWSVSDLVIHTLPAIDWYISVGLLWSSSVGPVGKVPFDEVAAEFTRRRRADAHVIVNLNTTKELFPRNFLDLMQMQLLTTLHKWAPKFFKL